MPCGQKQTHGASLMVSCFDDRAVLLTEFGLFSSKKLNVYATQKIVIFVFQLLVLLVESNVCYL